MLMLHATGRAIAIDTALTFEKGKTTCGLRGLGRPPFFTSQNAGEEGAIQDKHKWLGVGVGVRFMKR